MASTGRPGRFTPKKSDTKPVAAGSSGAATSGSTSSGAAAPAAPPEPLYKSSGRYTPPIPKEFRESPKWVPILMFALLVLGLLTIIANYMGLFPGEASNWYLLLGLAFITGGFITATQLR